MTESLSFAFFGSSLISSYWNGACTYYRGLIRALHGRGHHVTFYEPRAYQRQEHRDIPDPEWAQVVVYEPSDAAAVRAIVGRARDADIIVKTSGVGVFDDVLEAAVLDLPGDAMRIFWDVDAPATLASMETNADNGLRELIPEYDLILTYGGGDPVVARYGALGARRCRPIYNGLDPQTHHPVRAQARYGADLTLLANRLPDREQRIREFFFRAASLAPGRSFLLGGNGWIPEAVPANVRCLGHVPTAEHNTVNCSARVVLNVSRDSMAANGFSPATRVFEAAGAGACLITDAWEGIDAFFAPGSELLVAADGAEVAALMENLDDRRAREIGAAARDRAVAEHTYDQRAELVEALVLDAPTGARA
ncbi:MAG TPA: glycosyltransferase [Solirubrobacteraceae bacterium]|nr:glycosyltransferase [Solirubrobacteraceae bacterium]